MKIGESEISNNTINIDPFNFNLREIYLLQLNLFIPSYESYRYISYITINNQRYEHIPVVYLTADNKFRFKNQDCCSTYCNECLIDPLHHLQHKYMFNGCVVDVNIGRLLSLEDRIELIQQYVDIYERTNLYYLPNYMEALQVTFNDINVKYPNVDTRYCIYNTYNPLVISNCEQSTIISSPSSTKINNFDSRNYSFFQRSPESQVNYAAVRVENRQFVVRDLEVSVPRHTPEDFQILQYDPHTPSSALSLSPLSDLDINDLEQEYENTTTYMDDDNHDYTGNYRVNSTIAPMVSDQTNNGFDIKIAMNDSSTNLSVGPLKLGKHYSKCKVYKWKVPQVIEFGNGTKSTSYFFMVAGNILGKIALLRDAADTLISSNSMASRGYYSKMCGNLGVSLFIKDKNGMEISIYHSTIQRNGLP